MMYMEEQDPSDIMHEEPATIMITEEDVQV